MHWTHGRSVQWLSVYPQLLWISPLGTVAVHHIIVVVLVVKLWLHAHVPAVEVVPVPVVVVVQPILAWGQLEACIRSHVHWRNEVAVLLLLFNLVELRK